MEHQMLQQVFIRKLKKTLASLIEESWDSDLASHTFYHKAAPSLSKLLGMFGMSLCTAWKLDELILSRKIIYQLNGENTLVLYLLASF